EARLQTCPHDLFDTTEFTVNSQPATLLQFNFFQPLPIQIQVADAPPSWPATPTSASTRPNKATTTTPLSEPASIPTPVDQRLPSPGSRSLRPARACTAPRIIP